MRTILFVTLFVINTVMSKEIINANSNLTIISEKSKNITIHKCCEMDKLINAQKEYNCTDTTEQFNPPIYKESDDNETIKGTNVYEYFIVTTYKAKTNERGAVTMDNFKLLENGFLQLTTGNREKYAPDKYCIDNIELVNETHFVAIIFHTSENEIDHRTLNSNCMLISCFFIILTLIVYGFSPRTLHAMVLMAYLLSFLVGFLFMATLLILVTNKAAETDTCVKFTFVIYFSLLSAFFWLNVMCFDIWYTFSGKRSTSGDPASVRARFISYSMYAFGVPTALTVLLAVLEYSIDQKKSELLPRLRLQECFISGKSKRLYFYGPIAILCVANLIFFVLTALKIAKTKKQIEQVLDTRKEKQKEKEAKKSKQRYILYIKLFVVMGFNWILEVVSSYFPEADYIWIFTDAYNVLVGLTIFIIFVCKKKTFDLIKDKLKPNRTRSSTNTGEMKNTSSTKLNRSQNNKAIGTILNIDTIRTSLGPDSRDTDSTRTSVRSDKSNTLG